MNTPPGSSFPGVGKVMVRPLSERKSLASIEELLVDPAKPAPACDLTLEQTISGCARKIKTARCNSAGVMLIFGAHLIKNGGQLLLQQLVNKRWVTHLATNGAGTIHDWEFSFLGRSTESVRENVATGTFGIWDETGRYMQMALLAGGLRAEGYGTALGRFIHQEGMELPSPESLEQELRREPGSLLSGARADLLQAMRRFDLSPGWNSVSHPHREFSVLAHAWERRVPLTVHPGIGYDIVATHPMFNGAVVGRAAQIDFGLFAESADTLDGGVVLSIGSAIMGPQVFEKTLSCVNNLRLQQGRKVVQNHSIYVVDLQDGGRWNWSSGEPPKSSPAYYLRFCKSYARMGGSMEYVQCDNIAFLQNLCSRLGQDEL